jgi:thiol-disulfide isomerase/thioredoxin
MIGLYFLLPCVAMTVRSALSIARGEPGVLVSVAIALTYGVLGALAMRGKFLVPLAFMSVELVMMVRGVIVGASLPRWEVFADSFFLVLSLAWWLMRRLAARGSWETARKSLCAALAVGFVAWTASFAIRLGEGIAILAVPQSARAAVVAGQKVPRVEFVDRTGHVEKLGQSGVVYVVSFWATWCGPCRMELPLLQKLAVEFSTDGKVRFVAVNTEALDRSAVDAFARSAGLLRLPTYVDPSSTHDALGVTIIPLTIVVKDRVVVARYEGYSDDTITELRSVIEQQVAKGGGADGIVRND